MALKPKFYGIKKGRSFILNESDKVLLGNYLQKFEDGKEMEMTVAKKFKARTSGQPGEDTNFNGYLWGVVYKIIGDEIGEMDLDYIHNWAQVKVGNIIAMPDGTIIPAGTSEMSGGEFAEYCSKVRMWAATPENICKLGMFIPDPNQVDFGS
jgi:hypothetical protein